MKSWKSYLYSLPIIALFFYSYTQVDLGLVFSRYPFLQQILRSFQEVGYFQRPLSTLIYISIIALLFAFYAYFLRLTFKKKISTRNIFLVILFTAIILVFSYNAFSYDLFNYIFDAKIITFYHQNPYIYKALDFPRDSMLAFMHWTHRTYPYGPLWLALTVPLTFIAQNLFTVSFFLFKLLAACFYLGSGYMIYKISEKIMPEQKNFSLVFFSLNPLVIIEALVSAHNDIAMVFFALVGVYALIQNKRFLGIVFVVASLLIKIPTVALLLPLAITLRRGSQDLIRLSVLAMIAVLIYVLTSLEMQPWYFLWIIPFIALTKPDKVIVVFTFFLSALLLIKYPFFLYFGNWTDSSTVFYKNFLNVFAPVTLIVMVILSYYKDIIFSKR